MFMQHENIIGYKEDYVRNLDKHPMDFLSNILNEKGQAKKIEVEKDNYYFSTACLESLQKNLPRVILSDANGLANWQHTEK